MLINVLVVASTALGVVNAIPYWIDMYRGGTRPSKLGNFIWAFASIVRATAFIYLSGMSAGAWLQVAFAVTGVITFALALRFGMKGITPTDIVALIIGVSAIAMWLWLGPQWAVLLTAVSTSAGYAATIAKTYRHPRTENLHHWLMVATGAALSFVAISLADGWVFVLLAPALVTVLGSLTVIAINFRRTEPVISLAGQNLGLAA